MLYAHIEQERKHKPERPVLVPYKIHQLTTHSDLRGNLCAGEIGKNIPFRPARFFSVYNVPEGTIRGKHAHKKCEQFLVCLSGQVDVTLDNGEERFVHCLDSPNKGLHIPAGIWGEQTYVLPSTILLVLASHIYDPIDYINDYNEYLEFRRKMT